MYTFSSLKLLACILSVLQTGFTFFSGVVVQLTMLSINWLQCNTKTIFARSNIFLHSNCNYTFFFYFSFLCNWVSTFICTFFITCYFFLFSCTIPFSFTIYFFYCIAGTIFAITSYVLASLGWHAENQASELWYNRFSAYFAKYAKIFVFLYFWYGFITFRTDVFSLLAAGAASVLRLASIAHLTICYTKW